MQPLLIDEGVEPEVDTQADAQPGSGETLAHTLGSN